MATSSCPISGAVTRLMLLATASLFALSMSARAQDLLPADKAFALSVRALDERTLEARFNVADGYYLYRQKLNFAVEPSNAGPLAPQLPAGKVKHDEFFGDVEIYRGLVVLRLPMPRAYPGAHVVLVTGSQGCADAGVCYPPQLQKLAITVPAVGAGASPLVEAAAVKLPWLR